MAAFERVDEPARVDDALDEGREGLRLKFLARRLVADDAEGKIAGDRVAFLDRFDGFGAFEDREPDVDGIAVEDAREGVGDDEGDAARLDGDGRVLARRAAAEVVFGDDDVALLHLVHEVLVDVLHAVEGELFGGRGVEIARGDDDVGIDVAAEFMHGALHFHVILPPEGSRDGLKRRSPRRRRATRDKFRS